MASEFDLFVGIDWAHTEHQIVILAPGGKRLACERFDARNAKQQQRLINAIRSRLPEGGRPCIGIESAALPLVDALLEQDWPVFLVNPHKVEQMRTVAANSGAKDDARDAHVIALMLPMAVEQGWIKRVEPRLPQLATLRELSRQRTRLVEQQTDAQNRLRAALARYWSAFLALGLDLSTQWVLAVWKHLRSPERARRLKPEPLQRLLMSHRGRHKDAKVLLAALCDNCDASPAEANAAELTADFAVQEMLFLREQLARVETLIKQALDELEQHQREQHPQRRHSDLEILLSMPGMGPMLAAVLFAEAGEYLAARDLESVRRLGGVAPVTSQSGARHQRQISMRYARNKHLSVALSHYGGLAADNDKLDGAKRRKMRERGHRAGRIRRQLADGLLKVAFALLRDDALYDTSRRVGARQALDAGAADGPSRPARSPVQGR